MQEDEQRLRTLQDKIIKVEEIKAPTAEDLEVFRNQLRIQVEGELDIDTKKSVLNSLIKKLKVDQNGLLEIDFGIVLSNTPYPVLPRPAGLANLGEVEGLLILNLISIRRST